LQAGAGDFNGSRATLTVRAPPGCSRGGKPALARAHKFSRGLPLQAAFQDQGAGATG